MRAVTTSGPGGPEVLQWGAAPDPVVGADEVLIRVVGAGVNRADIIQRQGFYPPPPGASDLIGLECSGVIAAVGANVTNWSEGDEVCALLAGGGYAEYVAVPAGQVMPVPAEVDLITAAGIPEVACTVWSNVTDLCRLAPGEWLLVHGGSSGIGTWAIQYAKAIGAKVATTAGTSDKVRRCIELGADIAVNYKEQDFADVIPGATDGHGVDVVLDTIGAKYLPGNLACLAQRGRGVTIGLMGGRVGELDLGMLLFKQGTWRASSLRSRPTEEKARICAGVAKDMWPLVESGAIIPVVDRVLPMAQASEAHKVMAASDHIGKILLQSP